MRDDRPDARHRFDARELAVVLSHYDLGTIETIKSCPLGSRRAPKLRIVTSRGDFLLKRRASGRDDPYRVAFTHSLQLPGGAGSSSGGQPRFIGPLAAAGVAMGVDAVFMEVHDRPSEALSDGANACPLDELESILERMVRVERATRETS